jgi:uncharacterized protein (TIGR02996 family)
MPDDFGLLQSVQANPDELAARLIYADWLEERGDIRADFLRLHLALKSLPPDHVHRVSGEQELSNLRKQIDCEWLAVVEPEHANLRDPYQPGCRCFDAGYADQESFDSDYRPKWPEMEFHADTQDTECRAWQRMLELIEEAAADERQEFAPLNAMEPNERSQIVTLPSTIAKLKSVKRLQLYRSHIVRIPPEIGEMASLEAFDPYTSWRLHWFPYEITHCKKLKGSRVSTRVLYGNYKICPPFPRLQSNASYVGGRADSNTLSLKYGKTVSARKCSVCNRPFEDLGLHRVWISLRVATDVLPLLVNACSEKCIRDLPKPPDGYVQVPHRGGPEVNQPPTSFPRP